MAYMLPLFLAVPGMAAATCVGDLCCSLNGERQVDATCICDKPWSGPRCGTMKFKHVYFPQGYGMTPNLTTWGGNIIFDGEKYHMFVSAMTNHCPLSTWGKNSRIDHAVSSSATGPYHLVDVAVNTWAHNAAAVTLHDGSFAVFHIGNGAGAPDGGENCNSTEYKGPILVPEAAGSTIHVSKSLNGPWKPLQGNTLGDCNNPAPWVHRNGTIFILCGDAMKRSENIAGPWRTVSTLSHTGGPSGNYEDPFLYIDVKGHFHLLYHVFETVPAYTCVNATVSAHAFSLDGFEWHMSASQPYTTQLALSTGKTITISTRERPKIVFDKSGKMTHLMNGVCSSTVCPPPDGPKTGCVDCKYKGWDYSLVAPLDIDEADHIIAV